MLKILNPKQLYRISIVTVFVHIVTTFRIFIKSPEAGQLDCPKYRENQLTRRYFFAVSFIIIIIIIIIICIIVIIIIIINVYFNYFKNSSILVVVVSYRSFNDLMLPSGVGKTWMSHFDPKALLVWVPHGRCDGFFVHGFEEGRAKDSEECSSVKNEVVRVVCETMYGEERVNNSVDLLSRVLVAFSGWSNFSVVCCNSERRLCSQQPHQHGRQTARLCSPQDYCSFQGIQETQNWKMNFANI